MERYQVRVTKDYLTFCAAHFITFEGNKLERLHGHNYQVTAEIVAPLNEDHLVFDFIALKRILRRLTDELDHRMMVPLKSSFLKVEADDTRVRLVFANKEWVFPLEDCVLLPLENTTAELLARLLVRRLRERLEAHAKEQPRSACAPQVIRMEVEETPGQSAVYEWTAS